MIAPCILPGRVDLRTEKIVPCPWLPEGVARETDRGTEVKLTGKSFFLHFVCDANGYVRDIAYSSKHESADLRMLLSVACDYASRLLQAGWTVAEIAAIGADQYMAAILARAAAAEAAARAQLSEEPAP